MLQIKDKVNGTTDIELSSPTVTISDNMDLSADRIATRNSSLTIQPKVDSDVFLSPSDGGVVFVDGVTHVEGKLRVLANGETTTMHVAQRETAGGSPVSTAACQSTYCGEMILGDPAQAVSTKIWGVGNVSKGLSVDGNVFINKGNLVLGAADIICGTSAKPGDLGVGGDTMFGRSYNDSLSTMSTVRVLNHTSGEQLVVISPVDGSVMTKGRLQVDQKADFRGSVVLGSTPENNVIIESHTTSMINMVATGSARLGSKDADEVTLYSDLFVNSSNATVFTVDSATGTVFANTTLQVGGSVNTSGNVYIGDAGGLLDSVAERCEFVWLGDPVDPSIGPTPAQTTAGISACASVYMSLHSAAGSKQACESTNRVANGGDGLWGCVYSPMVSIDQAAATSGMNIEVPARFMESVTLASKLNVDGESHFTELMGANATITGDLTIMQGLNTLTTVGSSSGNIMHKGTVHFESGASFEDAVELSSASHKVTVAGSMTARSKVTVKKLFAVETDMEIDGELGIQGNIAARRSMRVDGDVYLGKPMQQFTAPPVGSNASGTNSTIHRVHTVHGPLHVTATDTGKSALTVNPSQRNVSMDGRLTVQGTTIMEAPVNVSCAGVRPGIPCVVVNGRAQIESDLTVTGDASASALTSTINKDLLVTGSATIKQMLEVAGNMTARGDVTLGSHDDGTGVPTIIEVLNSEVVVGAPTAPLLHISPSEGASINGKFEVDGAVSFLGDVDLGTQTQNHPLQVYGQSKFMAPVTANAPVDIRGQLTATNPVNIQGGLTASGDVALAKGPTSKVTVNGQLQISDRQTSALRNVMSVDHLTGKVSIGVGAGGVATSPANLQVAGDVIVNGDIDTPNFHADSITVDVIEEKVLDGGTTVEGVVFRDGGIEIAKVDNMVELISQKGVTLEDINAKGGALVLTSQSNDITVPRDVITLTNQNHQTNMANVSTNIRWEQYYHDSQANHQPAAAADIGVVTANSWSSDPATHNSYMSFATVHQGVLAERARITPLGDFILNSGTVVFDSEKGDLSTVGDISVGGPLANSAISRLAVTIQSIDGATKTLVSSPGTTTFQAAGYVVGNKVSISGANCPAASTADFTVASLSADGTQLEVSENIAADALTEGQCAIERDNRRFLEIRSDSRSASLELSSGGTGDTYLTLQVESSSVSSQFSIRNVNRASSYGRNPASPDAYGVKLGGQLGNPGVSGSPALLASKPSLVIHDNDNEIVTLDNSGNLWISGSMTIGDYDASKVAPMVCDGDATQICTTDADCTASATSTCAALPIVWKNTQAKLQSSGHSVLALTAGASHDSVVRIESGPNQNAMLRLVDPQDGVGGQVFEIYNEGGASNHTLRITDGINSMLTVVDQGDVGRLQLHGDVRMSATGNQNRKLRIESQLAATCKVETGASGLDAVVRLISGPDRDAKVIFSDPLGDPNSPQYDASRAFALVNVGQTAAFRAASDWAGLGLNASHHPVLALNSGESTDPTTGVTTPITLLAVDDVGDMANLRVTGSGKFGSLTSTVPTTLTVESGSQAHMHIVSGCASATDPGCSTSTGITLRSGAEKNAELTLSTLAPDLATAPAQGSPAPPPVRSSFTITNVGEVEDHSSLTPGSLWASDGSQGGVLRVTHSNNLGESSETTTPIMTLVDQGSHGDLGISGSATFIGNTQRAFQVGSSTASTSPVFLNVISGANSDAEIRVESSANQPASMTLADNTETNSGTFTILNDGSSPTPRLQIVDNTGTSMMEIRSVCTPGPRINATCVGNLHATGDVTFGEEMAQSNRAVTIQAGQVASMNVEAGTNNNAEMYLLSGTAGSASIMLGPRNSTTINGSHPDNFIISRSNAPVPIAGGTSTNSLTISYGVQCKDPSTSIYPDQDRGCNPMDMPLVQIVDAGTTGNLHINGNTVVGGPTAPARRLTVVSSRSALLSVMSGHFDDATLGLRSGPGKISTVELQSSQSPTLTSSGQTNLFRLVVDGAETTPTLRITDGNNTMLALERVQQPRVQVCDSSLCDTSFDTSCPCSAQNQIPKLLGANQVDTTPDVAGNLIVTGNGVFGTTAADGIAFPTVDGGSTTVHDTVLSVAAGQKASMKIIGAQGATLSVKSGPWAATSGGALEPGISAPAQIILATQPQQGAKYCQDQVTACSTDADCSIGICHGHSHKAYTLQNTGEHLSLTNNEALAIVDEACAASSPTATQEEEAACAGANIGIPDVAASRSACLAAGTAVSPCAYTEYVPPMDVLTLYKMGSAGKLEFNGDALFSTALESCQPTDQNAYRAIWDACRTKLTQSTCESSTDTLACTWHTGQRDCCANDGWTSGNPVPIDVTVASNAGAAIYIEAGNNVATLQLSSGANQKSSIVLQSQVQSQVVGAPPTYRTFSFEHDGTQAQPTLNLKHETSNIFTLKKVATLGSVASVNIPATLKCGSAAIGSGGVGQIILGSSSSSAITLNGHFTAGSAVTPGVSSLTFDTVPQDNVVMRLDFKDVCPTCQSSTIIIPDESGTVLTTASTVSTLTQVGALASGSIQSGFGSITVDSDISTTSSISSGGIVTANGNFVASDNVELGDETSDEVRFRGVMQMSMRFKEPATPATTSQGIRFKGPSNKATVIRAEFATTDPTLSPAGARNIVIPDVPTGGTLHVSYNPGSAAQASNVHSVAIHATAGQILSHSDDLAPGGVNMINVINHRIKTTSTVIATISDPGDTVNGGWVMVTAVTINDQDSGCKIVVRNLHSTRAMVTPFTVAFAVFQ